MPDSVTSLAAGPGPATALLTSRQERGRLRGSTTARPPTRRRETERTCPAALVLDQARLRLERHPAPRPMASSATPNGRSSEPSRRARRPGVGTSPGAVKSCGPRLGGGPATHSPRAVVVYGNHVARASLSANQEPFGGLAPLGVVTAIVAGLALPHHRMPRTAARPTPAAAATPSPSTKGPREGLDGAPLLARRVRHGLAASAPAAASR